MKRLLNSFILISALGASAAPAFEPTAPIEQPIVDEEVADIADAALPDDFRFVCRAVYHHRSGSRESFNGSSRHSRRRAAERALEACRLSVRHPERCELRRCHHEEFAP